jgi:hypothetical protein
VSSTFALASPTKLADAKQWFTHAARCHERAPDAVVVLGLTSMSGFTAAPHALLVDGISLSVPSPQSASRPVTCGWIRAKRAWRRGVGSRTRLLVPLAIMFAAAMIGYSVSGAAQRIAKEL